MSDDRARRPNLATILFTDVVGSTAEATLGRIDEAAANYELAISLCEENGVVPQRLLTKVDYAETLIEFNRNPDRARELLTDALPECRRIGMGHVTERAEIALAGIR